MLLPPSLVFSSVIYIAQVSFASTLKGLIEYLIYLLFSTGREVFIQVENVYQDIPFFLERRGISRVLKLFQFVFRGIAPPGLYRQSFGTPAKN